MIQNDIARCWGNVDAEGYTDRQCEQCLRRLAAVEDSQSPRVYQIALENRAPLVTHIIPLRQWPCPNRIEAK